MTPGVSLPVSLTMVTLLIVPVAAVTRTGPAGLTSSALADGTMDSAAGSIGDGRGAA